MIRSTLSLLVLAAALSSYAQTAVEPIKMSSQMTLQNVPVPTPATPQRIVFRSDRPRDILIVGQKRSLVRLQPSEVLISQNQIQNLYRSELGKKITAAQAETQIASGYTVYGNFMDGIQGRAMYDKIDLHDKANLYQIVILNSNKVEKTILQMEWFNSGVGGHAQLRFKTSQPMLLISQDDPSQTRFIPGDVVYGLMAIRTEHGNNTWGAVTALTGSFANSYSLSTPQHMAGIQLNVDNGSFMQQYEMNLPANKQQALFNNSLMVGTNAREREIYNLVFNNCVEAIMRALKTVDARVDGWEFNPYAVLPQLKKLNLLGKEIQTANAEFQAPVQSLQTATNASSLALAAKLQPVMELPAFEQSLRVLAATIIQDHWTADELNTVFDVAQKSYAGASASSAQMDIPQLMAQVKAALDAQASQPLVKKTEGSIQNALQGLAQVLAQNKISIIELMKYLNDMSLTSRK